MLLDRRLSHVNNIQIAQLPFKKPTSVQATQPMFEWRGHNQAIILQWACGRIHECTVEYSSCIEKTRIWFGYMT